MVIRIKKRPHAREAVSPTRQLLPPLLDIVTDIFNANTEYEICRFVEPIEKFNQLFRTTISNNETELQAFKNHRVIKWVDRRDRRGLWIRERTIFIRIRRAMSDPRYADQHMKKYYKLTVTEASDKHTNVYQLISEISKIRSFTDRTTYDGRDIKVDIIKFKEYVNREWRNKVIIKNDPRAL